MSYQNEPNTVDETPGTKNYCACGESFNKPYCDGSHERLNTGKVCTTVSISERRKVTICDCGQTRTAPFCDGSHLKIEDRREPSKE